MFSLFGRIKFSISIFDRGMVSRESWRLKSWLIVQFVSFFGGPDKFILSVRFSFSIKGKRSVLYNCCLIGFCCVLFLIHDECSTGLNVDFSSRSTS